MYHSPTLILILLQLFVPQIINCQQYLYPSAADDDHNNHHRQHQDEDERETKRETSDLFALRFPELNAVNITQLHFGFSHSNHRQDEEKSQKFKQPNHHELFHFDSRPKYSIHSVRVDVKNPIIESLNHHHDDEDPDHHAEYDIIRSDDDEHHVRHDEGRRRGRRHHPHKNQRRKKRKRRADHNSKSDGPIFEKSLFIVSVPEEKEKGYVVTTLTATDANGKDLIYSMSAVLDARSQSMFSIDSNSGVVTTTTKLDREFMDVHYLRITAVDTGIPPKTGFTTLQVNVNDENDHQPSFEQSSYHASIRESVPIGTTVLTVRATDQDVGSNSEIEYAILNPTGLNEVFRIDSHSGVISTRGSLDRELMSSYSLNIQASDMGPLTTRKNSQTTVYISILDDNDCWPQFSSRSYSVSVKEDIPYANRPVIIQISATDADEDLNSAIRYSIISGNTQSHFSMDSITGEISVISQLDYETTRSYRLIIRAQDAGSPPRSNTTQLLINIEDVNDEAPKFYSTLFQESVMENTPKGTKILRVQAYDADDGLNSQINYSIKDYSSIPNFPLEIESSSGWILTTKDLDWEEGNLYEFTVIATDSGDPPKSSSASVIIRVNDLNDNDPVFDQRTYDAVVSEVDPPGTTVLTVTATDRDQNSRLNFQITSGNLRGRFNIVSHNNQGVIMVSQALDYKTERRFVLSVTATDSGGRSDTATVYINVTDANTHRPVIERTPYSANIPEDVPIGSTVLVIEASDADVGENARITFSMDDVPEFRIDPVTGAITTVKQLDRETTAGFTIVVTAMDNGKPSLADSTNVEIEISDVNDNSPVFRQDSYTASVSEDVPIGTSITQVQATDADSGLNAQIRYSFAPGKDGDGSFIIDSTSGVIRTYKNLDRELHPVYELEAVASDKGTPSLQSIVKVSVKLSDVNDNPPRFSSSDKLVYFVPENSPVGFMVGEIKAIDPDEGENSRIEYSIVGGPDANSFSLHSRPGDKAELLTRTELDFESSKKIYSIRIRASSLPLRTDVDVEIHVQDMNDNAPILNDFWIIFNNYKNHFPVNSIGKIPAFDADVDDHLVFKFLSGNNANLLHLNESSGDIKLSPSLNTNVPTRALFEVSVFDGINEATAQCQLIINLVTESMLFNSVTIRLNRISQKDFLSSLYDRFLEGLSTVIPTSKENIVIFSIQDDAVEYGSHKVLNVSFSVRTSGDRNLDSFLTPQYIQERIYLSRAILTRGTGLEILPFDDNLCVREPCLNFEECLSVLKFGRAGDFMSSETILFRPIHPVNTFACRCPNGFSGMYHKFECDVEVNLCYSNPCQNNGRCQRRESGYTCLCQDGFVGKNCEINLSESDCKPGVCKGNSHCVKGSFLTSTSSYHSGSSHNHHQDISDRGFRCANCTLADWSSSLCELRSRSFSRGSYITFHSLKQRNRLNLQLKFATRQDNVLLLYNGRYNEEHDFISLEIVESSLIFSFSLGDMASEVSVSPSDGYLTDGQWHQVEVTYVNRTARLKVDGCDSAVGRKQIKSGESFTCANSTHLRLDERCKDRMQSCYRFLDLTGPLQVGGLPPLPTRFQTRSSSFVGCISDLMIDHEPIDMNQHVANNGTISGCLEKRGFCHSFPCKNRAKCHEGWGTYVCECPDGYTGQDCSQREDVIKNFKGDGHVSFSPHLQPLRINWLIQISFKTFEPNGLLMSVHLGQNNQIILDIVNGRVRYTYNSESLVIPEAKVNDGKWHTIGANWMINGIWLNLDHGMYESNRDLTGDINGMYISKVSVGGLPSESSSSSNPETEILESSSGNLYRVPGFVGCIQGVDVGFGKDSWLKLTTEKNVQDGCFYPNNCNSNPCPVNSECRDEGLGRYSCICHSGHVGSSCMPACELGACSSGSTCVPHANNTRGYKCECDPLHTGIYCEESLSQVCPSNWWGRPICGPCTCDTSKGYDENCNKTTGGCSCQTNHYQPLDSDTCYDCGCYSVGSFSNKCDVTTGQCKCRPGVIGRRCDSCASPFAEVTLKGCEVIYDACPKSFSDGIWWERTIFGETASESCPPGSAGKALRRCHESEGWQEADLFNCISTAFSELADQLLIFGKNPSSSDGSLNSFPISTYLSIKISNDLKTALNSTQNLYGSDVFITFRFVNLLLTYEMTQSGLNLTHKQDRHFLPNLIEATSRILEQKYEAIWMRIGESADEGGPEYLLKLFNSYLEVLIKNREDTFTEPFEMSSKNLIFGMDTISTSQLWDMPYIESVQNRSNIYMAAASSQYLDHFNPDSGVSVALPKYNNYPSDREFNDDITKIIVPLKTINVPTALESLEASLESALPNSVLSSSAHRIRTSFGVSTSYSQKPTAVFAYAIFKTIGNLLPQAFDYVSVRNRMGLPVEANSPLFLFVMKAASPAAPIISSNINMTHVKSIDTSSSNTNYFLEKQLHPKINFRFKVLSSEGRTNPRCVYWTFAPSTATGSLASSASMISSEKVNNKTSSSVATTGMTSSSYNPRGKWSAKGCEVKGVYPSQRLFSTYQYINCSCDRIVPVTILMDVSPAAVLFEEDPIQNLISYAGLITSTVVLMMTFFILSAIRGLGTNSNAIHKNIVFCLFSVNLLFLVALKLRDELIQKEFPCRLMAVFLQYFYICIFSWMLVEGIHLHRMMTEIRDINHGPMKFYYFIGYAVPAVIVGLSLGVRADQYGNSFFCWLSIHESIVWSMIGPIIFLSTMNIIIFAMALRASIQIKDTICDYGNLRTLLWLSIVLLPLLGSNWFLALLSVNDSLDPNLHVIFYLISVITALYVFIGYCIVNRRVRFNMKLTYWKLKGKKVSVVDESLSVTRVSLASRSNPGIYNSPFDLLQSRGFGISTASTTSRSTTTKASSTPQHTSSKSHHHKKRSHHHSHHHNRRRRGESSVATTTGSNPSLELASSHSSDEYDDDIPEAGVAEEEMMANDQSTLTAPTQNEINCAIQQSLISSSSPHIIPPHHVLTSHYQTPTTGYMADYVSRASLQISSLTSGDPQLQITSNPYGVYGSRPNWSSTGMGMNIAHQHTNGQSGLTHQTSASSAGVGSTISDLKPLAGARPYNRSNILAMGIPNDMMSDGNNTSPESKNSNATQPEDEQSSNHPNVSIVQESSSSATYGGKKLLNNRISSGNMSTINNNSGSDDGSVDDHQMMIQHHHERNSGGEMEEDHQKDRSQMEVEEEIVTRVDDDEVSSSNGPEDDSSSQKNISNRRTGGIMRQNASYKNDRRSYEDEVNNHRMHQKNSGRSRIEKEEEDEEEVAVGTAPAACTVQMSSSRDIEGLQHDDDAQQENQQETENRRLESIIGNRTSASSSNVLSMNQGPVHI